MEDPLKAYNDVLKISGGEAVANEMPFVNYPLQGGKWVCPDCAKDIPIINSIDDPETFIPIKDHMKYEHNYTDNQVENVLGIDYHSQNAHKRNLHSDGMLGRSYFGGKWYDNTDPFIFKESVANEMPFSGGHGSAGHSSTWTWTCPLCSQPISHDGNDESFDFRQTIFDHLRSHGYSDQKIRDIWDEDLLHQMRVDRIIEESITSEADNYPQKQQMSQADWNDDLDDMRKTFGGANDEIEEDDGLDEDRVEIDISGDDVEIEDFDDDDVEIEDYDDEEIEDTVNESWRLHYSFGGDPIGVDEYDVNPNVEPDYNLYQCDYCHRLINISREDPVEHLKIHNISDGEEFSDQGGDNEPEMESEWKEVERITKEAHDMTATGKYDNSSDFQWHKADSSDLLRIDQPRLDAYGNPISSWGKIRGNTDTMGRADRLSDNPTKGYNESYSSEDYGMYNVIDNPNLETHGYPRDEEGFARASWDDATIEDRKNWLIVSRGIDPEIAEDEAYKPYFSLDTYTRADLIKDLQVGGIHAMGTGYL